jgi:hypothetical protein
MNDIKIFAIVLSAAALGFAASAVAQTSGTQAPQKVPEAAGTAPSASLSHKLSRSGGMITPPSGVDPGMTKPAPAAGSHGLVIRPPGTAGGNPAVKPK